MRGILAALLASVLLAACATTQKPVYLEKANVLPVQLDDHFKFRKQDTFFNDPRTYLATQSEAMRFFRYRMNFGVVTPRDYDEVTGNYFTFFWWAHQRADVTVRLEYRQAGLGDYVMAQELYYPNASGSYKSDFRVTGDEYLEHGRVTEWRVLLIVDGRIAAFRQSFMWK
ncbi:MAG TPA: hypothetical protein VNB29_06145 [Chthoniobacterales bacterium]|nr:hypothetical protein [Chthoniobacterales bacterium]